jgi:hypothetical protein
LKTDIPLNISFNVQTVNDGKNVILGINTCRYALGDGAKIELIAKNESGLQQHVIFTVINEKGHFKEA